MEERFKRLLPVKVRFTKILSCDLRIAGYTIDRQTIERAKRVRIFGIPVLIASPEDVITYKLARFEDIDKSDIKLIIQRIGRELDFSYIKNSVRRLAKEAEDEEILHNLQEILLWKKKSQEVRGGYE